MEWRVKIENRGYEIGLLFKIIFCFLNKINLNEEMNITNRLHEIIEMLHRCNDEDDVTMKISHKGTRT